MADLIILLQQNPSLFVIAVGVISLIVGSFLNVVIYRLPKMMELDWQAEYKAYFTDNNTDADAALAEQEAAETKQASRFNLAVPRSCCPVCNNQIKAYDNIPVLSWLLLKGQCRNCKTPISKRYPIIEALTAVMAMIVAWQLGAGLAALVLIVLTWGLIALTFIDIDKMLLPDQLTLPLLWLMLIFSLSDSAMVNPSQAIVGAAAGYLSLWSVYWLFKLLTGKEGMGYGDFKLLAVFGALLGWQQLPLIILLSSCVGAVVGIILLSVQGKDKATPIPFGPYIAAAGWIAMLWGEQISQVYLNTIGIY
ncbi:prepilin peptidase [Rheinheimera sp. WS51]|uniref:prepilin peptidase n=1 Tax=Rheinheimera sp. WS51 TaxID=3425886 RepID=UPI003D95095A